AAATESPPLCSDVHAEPPGVSGGRRKAVLSSLLGLLSTSTTRAVRAETVGLDCPSSSSWIDSESEPILTGPGNLVSFFVWGKNRPLAQLMDKGKPRDKDLT
ncbi:hypothetical protein THAOC_04907, partial [Thalassiosira oceanica]